MKNLPDYNSEEIYREFNNTLEKLQVNEKIDLLKNNIQNIITNNEIPTQSGSALDAFLSNFQSAVEVPKEKYNVSEEVVYKILEYNTIKEKIEYFNQLEYAIKQAVDSDEIISEKEDTSKTESNKTEKNEINQEDTNTVNTEINTDATE